METEHAEQELQRADELYRAATISDSEMSRIRRDAERAKLREARAKAELESARELGEIEVKAAENELARCQITARLAGIVTETRQSVGDWVNPGDPVCRIVNMDRLRAEAFADLSKWNVAGLVGREVTVEARGLHGRSERVAGKITYLAPTVERGSRVLLRVELENPTRDGQWILQPGLAATISVNEDQPIEPERPRRKAESSAY